MFHEVSKPTRLKCKLVLKPSTVSTQRREVFLVQADVPAVF